MPGAGAGDGCETGDVAARGGAEAGEIAEAVAAAIPIDVVLVDGRSGSGKTSFAARLVSAMRAAGRSPQLLRVEDLYPGWDGLAAGSLALAGALDTGEYRRYDWYARAFAETHRLEPRLPLVIEGCGAITEANLAAALRWADRAASAHPEAPGGCAVVETAAVDAAVVEAAVAVRASCGPGDPPSAAPVRPRVLGLWIDCPAETRRERALARDGEAYAPHWYRWAAQEDALFGVHRPWLLADAVLCCGAG